MAKVINKGEQDLATKYNVSGGYNPTVGTLAILQTGQYATFADDVAGSAAVGMIVKADDNSDGVSGDPKYLTAALGQYWMTGSGIAESDIMNTVYVSGSSTTTSTVLMANSGSNSVEAGQLVAIDATRYPSTPFLVHLGKRGFSDATG